MEINKRGRRIILIISILILSYDIFMAVSAFILQYSLPHIKVIDSNSIELFNIRLLLDLVLIFFLVKRHKWAKLVLGVYLMLTGIMCIPGLMNKFQVNVLFLCIFYVLCAVVLLFSPSVKGYFNSKPDKDKC